VLASNSSDRLSTTSVYRNDPSPPLIVGRSQFIAASGNGYGDVPEPISGLSDDCTALEIQRPAPLKSYQKRRPSRGNCGGIVTLNSMLRQCLLEDNLACEYVAGLLNN